MPLDYDPSWYRATLHKLAAMRNGGGPLVNVWVYLTQCVIDAQGWTRPMTKSFIAQQAVASRSRAHEALSVLQAEGLILDARREPVKEGEPPRPGQQYQMWGVVYYTKKVYPQGTVSVPPGNSECSAREQILNLAAANLPEEEILSLLQSQQQQDSDGVPPGNTCVPPGNTARSGNGHSVPPGRTIDLASAAAEAQAGYWLRLAGVAGSPALELAQRLDPVDALAWALEAERWRAEGVAENPPGLLVTLVRAGSRPPAAMQAYASWLLEDVGALTGLALAEIAGGPLRDVWARSRYVTGEYADYVER